MIGGFITELLIQDIIDVYAVAGAPLFVSLFFHTLTNDMIKYFALRIVIGHVENVFMIVYAFSPVVGVAGNLRKWKCAMANTNEGESVYRNILMFFKGN